MASEVSYSIGSYQVLEKRYPNKVVRCPSAVTASKADDKSPAKPIM
jgi:hypothetical protein